MGREHVSPQSKEIGLLSLGVDLWFAKGQREDADHASFFVPDWRRYDREFRHVEARIFGGWHRCRLVRGIRAMFFSGNFYILAGRLRLVRRFLGAHLRIRVCFV